MNPSGSGMCTKSCVATVILFSTPCSCDGVERLEMQQDLAAIIHHSEDSVLIVDLGPARTRGEECFTFMGVQPVLPTGEAAIV